MSLTDERKIRDDEIKANQTQYDLDREAAKISALSSKELDKYEYLTSEDLEYKSEVVERAKFEYYPLDEALNKGFKEDDKVKRIVKYSNDLMYDSVHDFNKYSVPNFNKVPSIDSKFDTLNDSYKDFWKIRRC